MKPSHTPASIQPRRPGRPPGPTIDPEIRRARLLDAAVRAIRRDGPTCSMDDLASEAGVTKPILYSHFGDRAGLAAALVARIADGIAQDLSSAVTAAATSPKDFLRQAIDTFIGFVEADTNVYEFVVRELVTARAGESQDMTRQALLANLGGQLLPVLAEHFHGDDADPRHVEAVAIGSIGMVLGVAEWWLARDGMPRAELVDLLTGFLWGGLPGSHEAGATREQRSSPASARRQRPAPRRSPRG